MDNGNRFHDASNFNHQLSNLSIGDTVNGYSNTSSTINGVNKGDGLFQVMKAVEAAEATIKQQVEENHRLRSELQKKIQELENYKSSDTKTENTPPIGHSNNHENKDFMETQINEAAKMVPGDHTTTNNGGMFSSASTSLLSPSRYQPEREYDPQFNASVHGQRLMTISGVQNAEIPLNQIVIDTRDQEQDILLLRKHLADFSIKEAKIHNEKLALEKRIAYMRLAFDQQQKDLVDAAYKALSYRQEIIEENIRLTYALQDAQEERTTYIQSLMPLLAEYSLQPPVVDAQSIVSNVKVLFRHLQEKLIGIETKLKESQYQLTAWRSDVNPSSYAPSPLHSFGNKNGLELVPQQAYSDGQVPMSSDHLTARGWDVAGHSGGVADNLEPDSGRYSPLMNRNDHSLGTNAQVASHQGNSYPTSKNEEITNKQVTFSDPVSNNDDDFDEEGNHNEGNEGEPFANWNSKKSSYTTTLEDPNSYSPYLSPVLEEPGSSFSEAADDDPLPAVEQLQISGEPLPGRELQASGYSINGTTSCNFEWVRHMEDGSVSYIEGAKQPTYLVTADDVDTYLAIEVQPMDNRKRKGELVKVFANENRKIVCDPDMHDHIRKALQTGYAEHRLSLWTGYLDIWEPVTLVIKKDGINIKGGGTPVNEKFSPTATVFIPYGNPVEFSIIGLGSAERKLRVEQEPATAIGSRDIIVLTLRYFIKRAVEKKKAKKKGLFF
ncbi:hypothetical protein HanRHA438_Chr12g0568271 [Helianthus annuus]|uniref:Uncharacterized protein n=1 Tax=Helianthus annuus TaxID=4232 RepID=A0A251V6Q9_HELAN|nr:uncharacterized protein LOC110928673 [Helianthus annuus]KAF5779231.1 hypothetical protein HanXRQr2_Chr12g0556921 [Helianthus annuus]KAJ0494769.1 hypothetical protein HanIR_Chr12g0601211 [Helianthus annuus]KAJ0506442.1 hypothetical protein HanHA89_Chr12g0482011 [Helianthus annuus]KAJ0629263.1 hypothetical protein HanHA300_Chr00c0634g0794391 [Helianthus annuus]KAJ0676118.1 hypothetical protein HanLR1_Chr12g0458991 [Helianthus annuus]